MIKLINKKYIILIALFSCLFLTTTCKSMDNECCFKTTKSNSRKIPTSFKNTEEALAYLRNNNLNEKEESKILKTYGIIYDQTALVTENEEDIQNLNVSDLLCNKLPQIKRSENYYRKADSITMKKDTLVQGVCEQLSTKNEDDILSCLSNLKFNVSKDLFFEIISDVKLTLLLARELSIFSPLFSETTIKEKEVLKEEKVGNAVTTMWTISYEQNQASDCSYREVKPMLTTVTSIELDGIPDKLKHRVFVGCEHAVYGLDYEPKCIENEEKVIETLHAENGGYFVLPANGRKVNLQIHSYRNNRFVEDPKAYVVETILLTNTIDIAIFITKAPVILSSLVVKPINNDDQLESDFFKIGYGTGIPKDVEIPSNYSDSLEEVKDVGKAKLISNRDVFTKADELNASSGWQKGKAVPVKIKELVYDNFYRGDAISGSADSGGPIIDANNNVVGILTRGDEKHIWFYTIEESLQSSWKEKLNKLYGS